jgi:uncharacterized heparinase superfamily protein
MTAQAARCPPASRVFLCPPWDACSGEALLEHFRVRPQVRSFAVAEPEETRRERIDALLAGRFEFNGEAHALPEPLDWLRNPSSDLEWHIMLHKFYYAVGLGLAHRDSGDARYLECWIELVSSWIDQVPAGFIAADVTGRRVQNWIYAFHLFVVEAGAELPPEFLERFLASIDEQVRHLCASLAPERNHRTLGLYAIFLAGVVFPELRGAAHWRRFALDELVLNVERDLQEDGVQCEQSTDYHHIVLRNYLCAKRLAGLNGIAVPARMDLLIGRALDFALHACRPDGIVPAFSDADACSHRDVLEAGHVLCGRDDLLYVASAGRHGSPPGHRSAVFAQSGYVVMRSGWGEREPYADERWLMYDCGPIGRGNHGHLDLHSFECAAFGRALVVDPGRYSYDESGEINWRRVFRGTAYHNTVTVDGLDQACYQPRGSRWRIDGPHPEHALRLFASREHCDVVHGVVRSHRYDAVHERCIWLVGGEYWIVTDILNAPTTHRYDLRFHLSTHAQGLCGIADDDHCTTVQSPRLLLVQASAAGTTIAIDDGFVSERYGEKASAPIVRCTRDAASTAFHTALHPFRDAPPSVTIEEVPVSDAHGRVSDAWAARIVRRGAGVLTTDLCFVAGDSARGPRRFAGCSYDGTHLLLRLEERVHGGPDRTAHEQESAPHVLYADAGASLECAAGALAGATR